MGGAVVRNRVKRRIRGALEAFGPLPSGRALLVAEAGAGAAPYARLEGDLRRLLVALGVLA
ncbi:MAG: ribonuclease P protein component [Candidatus Dormibacteria bacterium]